MKPLTKDDLEWTYDQLQTHVVYRKTGGEFGSAVAVLEYLQKCQEKAEKYDKIVIQGSLPLVEVTHALEIVERLKKEQKKNQELLDELIEEEKEGFVSEEYKESLEDGAKFFQKILEDKE